MKQAIFHALAFGEKACQWAQGKGYGAASIAREVSAALPFIPDHGAVILDIGANHGDWTRELLRRAGSRVASVFAFEPSKHNHASIEAINDARVQLVKKAVSTKSGTAVLYYDAPGSGLASLTKRRLDHHAIQMAESEAIETLSVDDFLQANSINRIDFAKLDIEGHEFDALRGAEKALTSNKIKALAFEFGGTNIDTRTYFQDFWYFLTERGYVLARINPFFAPAVIDKYSESLEAFRTTNFICFIDRAK